MTWQFSKQNLRPAPFTPASGRDPGLFTATLLRKAGWHTEVFERSPVELIGRGAGITTHPELLQSLVRSGADLNDPGVVVHERIALDAGGAPSTGCRISRCR
jgi:2-polyprenyl-6-methoxyphenol hydroxylase-like FAD-dependent oxidoreductase